MPMMRARMTGSDDQVRTMLNLIDSMDGIHSIEEVDDLMPHLDDWDSSSAGLSDLVGPKVHEIELDLANNATAGRVQREMEALAFDLDMLVEISGDDET